MQPDTVVDGPALQALADARGGRVAWVSRRPEQEDGTLIHDERYWDGKVAQWRTTAGETWALTAARTSRGRRSCAPSATAATASWPF